MPNVDNPCLTFSQQLSRHVLWLGDPKFLVVAINNQLLPLRLAASRRSPPCQVLRDQHLSFRQDEVVMTISHVRNVFLILHELQETFRRCDLDFDIPEYPVRLIPRLFDLVSILCALGNVPGAAFDFDSLFLCCKGRDTLTLRLGTGVTCSENQISTNS
jgi:hypothetical protein